MEILLTILLIIVVWKWRTIADFFRSITAHKENIAIETKNNISSVQSAGKTIDYDLDECSANGISSFQDTLKSVSRTKEEIEQEDLRKQENRIYTDAQNSLKEIQSSFISKAKVGEIDDDGVISILYSIPTNYYNIRYVPATYAKVKRSRFDPPDPPIEDIDSHCRAIMQMSRTDAQKFRLVEQTRKRTVFEAADESKIKRYIEELSRMASIEGITIESPIVFDRKNNVEFDFPCEIPGNIEWVNYGVILRCKCAIPEKYSTDHPIKIALHGNKRQTIIKSAYVLNGFDENDHLLKGVVDSLVNKGFNSITTNRSENNQWLALNCYRQGQEYSFVFRCHSLDLDDEIILESVLRVFEGIIIGEDDIANMQNQYIELLTNLEFYNISVNIVDNHVVFLKGHKNAVKYSFRFNYPKEAVKSLPIEHVQSHDDIDIINIDYMEGHDFEQFCAKLLLKNGFDSVEVTRGSGDQGVDIIAVKDGVKYGIQCKCYSSDIGNSAVQEVFAGKTFYKCHVGAVLTNRYFTRSAKTLADSNGILLWDRKYLLKLIKNAGIKIN